MDFRIGFGKGRGQGTGKGQVKGKFGLVQIPVGQENIPLNKGRGRGKGKAGLAPIPLDKGAGKGVAPLPPFDMNDGQGGFAQPYVFAPPAAAAAEVPTDGKGGGKMKGKAELRACVEAVSELFEVFMEVTGATPEETWLAYAAAGARAAARHGLIVIYPEVRMGN